MISPLFSSIIRKSRRNFIHCSFCFFGTVPRQSALFRLTGAKLIRTSTFLAIKRPPAILSFKRRREAILLQLFFILMTSFLAMPSTQSVVGQRR